MHFAQTDNKQHRGMKGFLHVLVLFVFYHFLFAEKRDMISSAVYQTVYIKKDCEQWRLT